MRALLLVPLWVLGLTACQMTKMNQDSGEVSTAASNRQPQYLTPSNSYRAEYTHKAIGDYADQIAMELVRSMGAFQKSDTLAVVSFVEFDQSLRNTSILGNQLAEQLIARMQTYGMTVVDFKTTGYIEVGDDGDLAFSRDFKHLAEQQNIDYLLAGTLSRNERGVEVNSRVISSGNGAVVATASNFIPGFVVDDLQPRLSQRY